MQQQTAVKLVGATFVLLIVVADVAFWIFGTSLLLAIDTSLTNSRRSSVDASGTYLMRHQLYEAGGGHQQQEEEEEHEDEEEEER